ncbi:hypothetical protein [Algibacter luteus]|uniref:hypothetical protein n=1 Tax=Algibacter luteus TaxID=1178825 RepID=UPI000365C2EC|nr:hypothetical protein [Algibacter luteus]WJJ97546.1 hypothetical protein O5O44_03995 [Algibacter luteus]
MKNITKYKITILLLVLLPVFLGCKNSKQSFENQTEIESTPKILFLNYVIEKTLDNKRKIEFINKKIVDGKLKNIAFEPIGNAVDGDLIFSELDSKLKTINKILIKNPLVQTIEYVDDAKQFQTKTLDLDKSQFSIRLQLKNATKYITISNFAENEPLIKTKIN